MEFLPVRDAARTCVLSRKWRRVWVNHPSLVLDDGFWDDILRNKSILDSNDKIDYVNTVSSILLSHSGHIRKFVIDVSLISKYRVRDKNVDLWFSYLCKKSLKELHFTDSDEADINYYYEVPAFVFLSSELNQLSLSFCTIMKAIGCFNTIQTLILHNVIIDSVVLTTPLLTSLSIKGCSEYDDDFAIDISAPKLASLTLDDNGSLNLRPFFTCTDIEYVFLSHADEDTFECDGKQLLDLLALWPKVSVLVVDGFYFKELATAGSIPDNHPISSLNLRRFALRDVNLDCENIAWILYVLKISPLLHTFEIRAIDMIVKSFFFSI